MSTNFKTKCGKTKMIFSVALFISAFLALIAVINAAPPRWRPLTPSPGPGGGGNGYSYNLFRGGATTVYDPTSNELILFAGFSDDPSPNAPRFNDLWVLTNANGLGGTPVWNNLILDGAPGSPLHRYHHSAVYDVVHNRMTIYGGCGSNSASEGCLPIANDVWVLIHANGQGGPPTWTQLFPTGTPPGQRQGHQAVYDPTTNSMIVWAGQNGGGAACAPGAYHDVWLLSNANGLGGVPHWSHLPTTLGPPPGDYFSTAVYDSSNNIMTVFGGIGNVGGNCTQTNAVWALSHANGTGGTPTWRRLTIQGAPGSPPSRFQHFAVYLPPPSNKMIIHGGTTTTGFLYNDTWVLSNANGLGGTPAWSRLQIPGKIPGASSRWNGGGIDPVNNRTIMSFGTGNPDGPQWGGWVLTNP
jgi:hypothetical protein